MRQLLLIAILLITCNSAFSAENKIVTAIASTSKKEFCNKIRNPNYFIQLAYNSDKNFLDILNDGGIGNNGVCWWHSRFQRASWYLATFRPDLPKPNKKMAKRIIRKLKAGWRVVEIPGHNNINEFTAEWDTMLTKELERWQLTDGILRFQWISGILGWHKTSKRRLRIKVRKLYNEVKNKKRITFIKMQEKGISTHSALVIDAKKFPGHGYLFKIIDSNSVAVENLFYENGKRSMMGNRGLPFVPYIEKRWELRKFRWAHRKYCKKLWK